MALKLIQPFGLRRRYHSFQSPESQKKGIGLRFQGQEACLKIENLFAREHDFG